MSRNAARCIIHKALGFDRALTHLRHDGGAELGVTWILPEHEKSASPKRTALNRLPLNFRKPGMAVDLRTRLGIDGRRCQRRLPSTFRCRRVRPGRYGCAI